ncbi:hypothetical protein GCM10009579_05940 [Streptomyces javensis]|uniref:Uncharacterized protein n=1 Tax=Streptomyces javensis TaxID=114698 RepID=A0ABN1WIF2_9ACTN
MTGNVDDVFPGRNATSGGVSETEVNDATVMPTGLPCASRDVMAVMPLGKWPRTVRKRAVSSGPGCCELADVSMLIK